MPSIYISPSDQLNNIGAGSYGTECARMNQIANYLINILNRYNITVYRNNPRMTLSQIIADSNVKRPDFHFAIHSNSGGGRGCEVFCYKFGSKGHAMANLIYKYLSPLTPTVDRGVKEGFNFYGVGKSMAELEQTTAPASLVEIAFHDSVDDAAWIINNMPIIAKALAQSILEYFGFDPNIDITCKIYKVQLGAFTDKAKAIALRDKVKQAGFEVMVIES